LKTALQLPGTPQQVLHLGRAIEVWRATTMSRTQHMAWRNLGAGFSQHEVFGKGANNLQTSSTPQGVSRLWQARPPDRQFRSQGTSVLESVHITSKLQEAEPFAFELKAKGAALIQIGTDLRQHGFHGLILGQGRAAWRSSSKLT
jgi:hypothetical protein